MEYDQYAPIIQIVKESKGIWMPAEIKNIKNISWSEKILLTRILWLSQKEGCFASNEYLAKEMMVSSRQIQRMLLNIKRKKLIQYKSINKNRYIKLMGDISVVGGVTHPSWGGDTSVVGGVTYPSSRGDINVTHNNTDNNTDNNTINNLVFLLLTLLLKDSSSHFSFDNNSEEIKISKYLINQILSIRPNFKKPNLQCWAKHVNDMFRLDKRKSDEIKQVIDWIFTDSSKEAKFWRPNILSTAKLRKQYDRIAIQMKESSNMSNWDEYLAMKKSGKL